jgi:hypothetical protein
MPTRMFEHPTQLSSIVLENANIWDIILMEQDDDDTDQKLSNDESKVLSESTISSDIEEDNLVNLQEVLHLGQVRHDKTIQTTSVQLPMKQSCANTVITHTPLRNLRHPVGAIAPPLFKHQKSAINISYESDIVQTLPLLQANGDQNVNQPKASGDHNVPQHPKATFEIAKWFIEATIFTKTPWPIISDQKYWMVDKPRQLAIEAQDHQQASNSGPVGAPAVGQLPGSPSLKHDLQTRDAVCVYSVFCSSIGLMMILNLETSTAKSKHKYHSKAFGRWSSSNYCLWLLVGFRNRD